MTVNLAALSLVRSRSHDSIPFRCKWRRDEALVFRQGRNRSAIFVVRGNAERVEIGLLAFRPAFNPWAEVIRLS
jgi:hypothetical protein